MNNGETERYINSLERTHKKTENLMEFHRTEKVFNIHLME